MATTRRVGRLGRQRRLVVEPLEDRRLLALESLTLSPTAAEMGVGGTQAFVATGTYSDGSARLLTVPSGTEDLDLGSPGTLPAGVTQVGSGSFTILGGTYAVDDFVVPAGKVLTVVGSSPLVVSANQVTIAGVLSANGGGGGSAGAAGGGSGGHFPGNAGGGGRTLDGVVVSNGGAAAPLGLGGGGGGGGGAGGGSGGAASTGFGGGASGAGGNGLGSGVAGGASVSGNSQGLPGQGGAGGGGGSGGTDSPYGPKAGGPGGGGVSGTQGDPQLLVFAGGGGAGHGGIQSVGPQYGGQGGAGGGAIAIFATGSIEVSGTVSANGGGGNCAAYSGYGGCGGGGGGGSIWLSAPTVVPSGVVSALGGNGGAEIGGYGRGGGGGAGRIRVDTADGVTPAGSFTPQVGFTGVYVADRVTWSSDTPAVAGITATGNASGVAGGRTLIQASSGSVRAAVTLTVIASPANLPPTDLSLNPDSIAENADTFAGDVQVGTLATEDPDPDNSFTYTLVAGNGDTDNGKFLITGDALLIKQGTVLDDAAQALYQIRVNVADGLNIFQKALTVTVNDVVMDFGDAPDSYGTVRASNGARHGIVSGFHLGSAVDADTDGQPGTDATGDDRDTAFTDPGDTAYPPGDDDGVAFSSVLVPGAAASVTVTASAPGVLDAWFDFDSDGTWSSTEKVFDGTSLTAGANELSFAVPAGATFGAATYARFRFSSTGVADPHGPATDGEVEDYALGLIQGRKFADVDGDGVRDPDEAGLNGWTIDLYDGAGTRLTSVVTASRDLDGNGSIDPQTEDGWYRFAGLPYGNYEVREVAQVGWLQTLPATGGHLATVGPSPFVFTDDADFEQGTLFQLNHDTPAHNQLQLNPLAAAPLNLINVASMGHGTVIRVNTDSGEIVGEYRTAPNFRAWNPSRTTVDFYGNVWVSNRDEDGYLGGTRYGSVTKIGLVLGGTRGDKNPDGSLTPNPNGQYLQGPFIYSTCADRDGDGLIRTSRTLNDVLDWPDDGDGVGGTDQPQPNGLPGDARVRDACDECILVYQRLPHAPNARHISVAADNNVWVAGFPYEPRTFHKLDQTTGAILDSFDARTYGAGGYGGLIDAQGVIWSSSPEQNRLLRYDPATDSGTTLEITASYGLGSDGLGNVWNSQYLDPGRVQKISAAGEMLASFETGGSYPRGVTVTADNHVWVANSGSQTVAHLSDSGTLLKTIPVGTTPTGVAVDSNGKIWVTNKDSNNAMRIDPQGGADGLGAVDLTVWLGNNASPYNYSDMTGSVLATTMPQGIWSVVQDAGGPYVWTSVVWNQELEGAVPPGAQISVEVRAAPTQAELNAQPWMAVGNGVGFSAPGRYLEARLTLRPNAADESPVLSDLVLSGTPVYEFGNQEQPVDYGDAPHPYPTPLVSDGARHVLLGPFLGAGRDAEPDGQPEPQARGDDNAGNDDEDGVVFTKGLNPGAPARVVVTASAVGRLDAWIDFNADGDWAEAGEQIFASRILAAGANALSFQVPADATLTESTFARFRFSTAGGLSSTGLAADGEVEDYEVAIESAFSDDIVGRNQYGYLWVAKSNGVNAFNSSIWGQWSTARTWSNVMAGDFNGDGHDDMVGRNEFGYWWVAVSNGSNGFTSSIWGKWDPTRTWTNVMVGDFNGDGCDDLVGRNQFGYWWVATSNGAGAFTSSIWGKWDPARTWTNVMVGDFNKDGRSDLVGRNEFGYWWVAAGNGSNGFSSSIWGKWDPSRTWTNVMVGDFNADGADDLVGRNNLGYWWVAASNGSSTLSNAIWGQWSTARTWTDVMVGDFDGNGADDVVGRNDYGYWWVAKSNGTDALTSGIWGRWDNGRNWVDVMVGDFNRDGHDDVVGRDKFNYWWVQKSNGWDKFAHEYWGKWNAVDWLDVLGGDFAT